MSPNTQRSKFNYQDVVLREDRSGGSFAKRKTDGVGGREATVSICINNVFKCRQM